MESQRYITFQKNGRTGNNIFQYLYAIIIGIKHGYTYLPFPEFGQKIGSSPYLRVNDDNSDEVFDAHNLHDTFILCDGYFQQSRYFVPNIDAIRAYLQGPGTNDYWYGANLAKENMHTYLTDASHSYDISEKDIVISLRLDDFRMPGNNCKTTNVIPPLFYTDIIEWWFSDSSHSGGRLIIVCDKIRYKWEYNYLQHFFKWKPVFNYNSLAYDVAIMRDCPVLVHSNSTLCWISSFMCALLGKKKRRFIPDTGFYDKQSIGIIDTETDIVIKVPPLEHIQITAFDVGGP